MPNPFAFTERSKPNAVEKGRLPFLSRIDVAEPHDATSYFVAGWMETSPFMQAAIGSCAVYVGKSGIMDRAEQGDVLFVHPGRPAANGTPAIMVHGDMVMLGIVERAIGSPAHIRNREVRVPVPQGAELQAIVGAQWVHV